MRNWAILGGLVALVLGIAPRGPAWAAPPAMDELVKVELAAKTDAAVPAETLWLDVHFSVKPGWHIYWRNPGDSGLPTTLAWTLPPGFAAGDIAWPVPQRFVVGGLANYGYTGTADLLVPVAVPADAVAGTQARLAADAQWLVCSEICIPGEARLALTLPVATAGAPDPASAGRFAAAGAALPVPAPFALGVTTATKELRLFVPAAALAGLDRPTAAFFPDDDNVIDQAADASVEPADGGIELVLATATGPTAKSLPGGRLAGVLVLRGGDGTSRAYTVSAAARAGPARDGLPWWQALLFAFVGGLVLNLMPCVLPILSLKLLSLVGNGDRGARQAQGLAYAAGVLLSFAVLGGALLGLRAGGTAAGWGFQLQSPLLVGLLAYLMLAMGLGLSGVAEFGLGLAGAGGRLAGKGGALGAFCTGVLATVVATPCTAPFMGAALGLAVIAPAPLALAIFLALGVGLATPLTLASLVPGIARIVPRPGSWMVLLKQILAFPLYATSAWLIWVLIQEVGPDGAFAALIGLVLVGFAVWVYGRTRLAAPLPRRLGSGLAAAGLVAAIALAAMPAPAASRVPLASDGLPYQPFTAARLAALTAAHTPVFVNLTAAWCITCLVNERATLDSAAVRQDFAAHGIVALKGDWTRRDPEIAAFLQSFGRSGVPLYLLYDGDGTATVLPQILTEGAVIAAVRKL